VAGPRPPTAAMLWDRSRTNDSPDDGRLERKVTVDRSPEPISSPPPAEPITPVERPRWEPPTLDLYEVACEVSAYAGRKRFGEEGED